MVGGFAVFRLVEADVLSFFFNPQSNGGLDNVSDDYSRNPRPKQGEANGFGLNEKLRAGVIHAESSESRSAEDGEK